MGDYKDRLLKEYAESSRRLLYLDYDGTLAPFKSDPLHASPTLIVKNLLLALARDTDNKVVVISGREKNTLEQWLGDLPITLVAEHGGFYREPGQSWENVTALVPSWKGEIMPLLRDLVFQYSETFIEEKYYSLAWHYRTIADRIQPDMMKILSIFQHRPAPREFLLYDEDCTLEFRTPGIDKGVFAAQYTKRQAPSDFIMAVGDGKTDEDLFSALGNNSFTIKVGKPGETMARYFVEKQESVLQLLQDIVSYSEERIGL